MLMLPDTEASVIAELYRQYHRGPGGLSELPAVWCFDHNWSGDWFPVQLLQDPAVAGLINATAFHIYSGAPSAMKRLRERFPNRPVLVSEGSEFGIPGAARIVEFFRNWASSYTAWVTLLDTAQQPNAGPFRANPTMVELDRTTMTVVKRLEYFIYGHFSKFVRPGAIRIESSTRPRILEGLTHVAFVNPASARGRANANATVLVLVNSWPWERRIFLTCNPDDGGSPKSATATLPPHSVATFRWSLCQ